MSTSLKIILEDLVNMGSNEQLIVSYDDKVCKVKRDDYFPDDNGMVLFRRKGDISDSFDTGYSVYELLELLTRYKDKVKDIMFEAWDGTFQPVYNTYESELYASVGEYTCVLQVGKSKGIFHQPGKVSQENSAWVSGDLLYPDRWFH